MFFPLYVTACPFPITVHRAQANLDRQTTTINFGPTIPAGLTVALSASSSRLAIPPVFEWPPLNASHAFPKRPIATCTRVEKPTITFTATTRTVGCTLEPPTTTSTPQTNTPSLAFKDVSPRNWVLPTQIASSAQRIFADCASGADWPLVPTKRLEESSLCHCSKRILLSQPSHLVPGLLPTALDFALDPSASSYPTPQSASKPHSSFGSVAVPCGSLKM